MLPATPTRSPPVALCRLHKPTPSTASNAANQPARGDLWTIHTATPNTPTLITLVAICPAGLPWASGYSSSATNCTTSSARDGERLSEARNTRNGARPGEGSFMRRC